MSDVFRQIDDDLRKDKVKRLWKNYGLYTIILFSIIVLSIIGYQIYLGSKANYNEKLVERYLKSSINENYEFSINEFNEIGEQNNKLLSGLALLRSANLAFELGKYEYGEEILLNLAFNKNIDKLIRDISLYFYLIYNIDEMNIEEIQSFISEMKINDSKLQFLYKEILAIKYLINDNGKEATKLFEEIIKDPNSPENLKTRSKKLIDTMR